MEEASKRRWRLGEMEKAVKFWRRTEEAGERGDMMGMLGKAGKSRKCIRRPENFSDLSGKMTE